MKKATTTCGHCASPLRANSRFCSVCGASADGGTPLPAPEEGHATPSRSWVLAGGAIVVALVAMAVVLVLRSGEDQPSVDAGTTTERPADDSSGGVAEPVPSTTIQLVSTPIGELPLLPRPSPEHCAALESFPFDEISGLDTSEWDNSDLAVDVWGFDPASRSIDLSFSAYLGLYLIRDGELVANLREGSHVDDPESRRRWDTWSALYTIRPDEGLDDPHPKLGVGGGDAGGGIRASTVPTVSNCSYNEGISTGEEAE